MIKQVRQRDLDIWDAWVEYDQENPNYFGVLYVIGDIVVNKKPGKTVIKKNIAPEKPTQLRLFIPDLENTNAGQIKEVIYSEPIFNLNQYSSICIYAGNDLIATLNEIEIII